MEILECAQPQPKTVSQPGSLSLSQSYKKSKFNFSLMDDVVMLRIQSTL